MRIVRPVTVPSYVKYVAFELECGHTAYRPPTQSLSRGKLLCHACRKEAREAQRYTLEARQ